MCHTADSPLGRRWTGGVRQVPRQRITLRTALPPTSTAKRVGTPFRPSWLLIEGWGFDSLTARDHLVESDHRPAHRFRKLSVREDRRKPQTRTEPEVGRRHETTTPSGVERHSSKPATLRTSSRARASPVVTSQQSMRGRKLWLRRSARVHDRVSESQWLFLTAEQPPGRTTGAGQESETVGTDSIRNGTSRTGMERTA